MNFNSGGGGVSRRDIHSYFDYINSMHSDPRGWSYNESTEEFYNGRTGEVIDARNPAAAFHYMGVDFRYIDVPKALKKIEQELEKAIAEVFFNHRLSQNGGLGTGGMSFDGDPPINKGNGLAVDVAVSYMVLLQADLYTPDPSDAVWSKWIGHAILGTTSAIILYISGNSILNPNLEGTTTSRGNPTDWSFDPRIRALENDKYYQPGSKPPRWFWPAIIGAGSYELYKDWPKRGTDQPIDNIYVEPAPIYPFEYKQGN